MATTPTISQLQHLEDLADNAFSISFTTMVLILLLLILKKENVIILECNKTETEEENQF